MTAVLLASPAGGGAYPPAQGSFGSSGFCPLTLYIVVDSNGEVKMGTCGHCVVEERKRPERAWDANGDQDLDFDRDTLLAYLEELGVTLTNRQAYVCP